MGKSDAGDQLKTCDMLQNFPELYTKVPRRERGPLTPELLIPYLESAEGHDVTSPSNLDLLSVVRMHFQHPTNALVLALEKRESDHGRDSTVLVFRTLIGRRGTRGGGRDDVPLLVLATFVRCLTNLHQM